MWLKACSALLFIILFLENGFCAEIQGKISTSRLKSLAGVLIYIEKVEGKEFSPSTNHPKIDQKNLLFVPRVLPVVKSTTVEFHNSDNLKHNVFGVGDDDFDLGTWGQGVTQTHTFNKLGEVAILCNVHTEMEAYVLVLQNPYFAITDKEGNYRIENVPEGPYRLKTWHDKLKSQTKEVVAPKEGSSGVDFEFK